MSAASLEVAPIPRMLVAETRARLLSRLRNPAFTFFSLIFPVMLFALFFAIFGHQRGVNSSEFGKYILASYSAYAVANVMVFNFGIGVANERGQKQDLLQRATPLPPLVATLAQVIFSLLFAVLALLILYAYAALVGGVRLSPGTWSWFTVKLLIGSLPMIGLGLAIGYGASANAAPALTNMIYLPMAFISGIFIPFSSLPDFIQNIARLLPLYHYGQLAWESVGQNTENLQTATLWLLGWGLVFFAAALRLYRRDETSKFA